MATFGIVMAIAIAALVAYVRFGGPRIPSGSGRVIDEVVRYRIAGGEANLVAEPVAKMLAFGLRPSADEVRDLGQLVLYGLRKRGGVNLAAAYHHQVAAATSAPRGAGLANLQVPTLVVHGDADPFFPVAHGRRLASTIPGARALWLEGAGHGFPYPDPDGVLDAITEHLRAAAAVAAWRTS